MDTSINSSLLSSRFPQLYSINILFVEIWVTKSNKLQNWEEQNRIVSTEGQRCGGLQKMWSLF